MKRLILILLFLIASDAYAEKWVCQETNYLRRLEGDCLSLQLCTGNNNTGLLSTCIEATDQEYIDAALIYKKIDFGVPEGSRIVNWTQTEIDVYEAALAAAQEAAIIAQIDGLDVTVADAFTAYVKVYNQKVPAQYDVTKQEIIDQIKIDLGVGQ